jgi:hypothetical protein
MASYFVIFSFIFISFGFMVLMLKFSKYKEKETGCCADEVESDSSGSDCFTCPSKQEKNCTPNQLNELDSVTN